MHPAQPAHVGHSRRRTQVTPNGTEWRGKFCRRSCVAARREENFRARTRSDLATGRAFIADCVERKADREVGLCSVGSMGSGARHERSGPSIEAASRNRSAPGQSFTPHRQGTKARLVVSRAFAFVRRVASARCGARVTRVRALAWVARGGGGCEEPGRMSREPARRARGVGRCEKSGWAGATEWWGGAAGATGPDPSFHTCRLPSPTTHRHDERIRPPAPSTRRRAS